MLNKDYAQIYAKMVLNEIKNIVRNNYMKIEGEKAKEVDFKLEETIKELTFEENGNMTNALFSNDTKTQNRGVCTLVLYYAALYNDNVDLLKELLDQEFNFGNHERNLNISVLDRRISSKFARDRDDYIKLVKDQGESFNNFYNALFYYDGLENERFYIDKFTSIMKKAIPSLDNDKKITPFERVNSSTILKVLKNFDEEAILNASLDQRNYFFNSFLFGKDFITNDDKEKLNCLLKNTNVSNFIFYAGDFLSSFTLEEIVTIDERLKNDFALLNELFEKREDREYCLEKLQDTLKSKDNSEEQKAPKKKKFSLSKKSNS